jgi:hypothetical protein
MGDEPKIKALLIRVIGSPTRLMEKNMNELHALELKLNSSFAA